MKPTALLLALPGLCTLPAGGDDGRLIVLNKSENSAWVLDLPGGEVLARLATGEGPHEVAVSPDARWAVVANYGAAEPGRSLTVIDLRRLEVGATIDLGEAVRPHGLAFARDGGSLWVTAELRHEVWRVSFPKGEVLQRLPTRQDVSHMVAPGPGGTAWVANIGSGSVTRVESSGEAAPVSLPTGAGAEGLAVSADGLRVWVANRAAGTVSVVDAVKGEVAKQLECPGFPIRVRLTPRGDRALVSCARAGELAVFDAADGRALGRVPMQLAAADSGAGRLFGTQFGDSPVPIGTAVHPAGRRAYVANSGADRVAVVDLEALEVVGALKTGREPDGIAWIPSRP